MFTGIIKESGKIKNITGRDRDREIEIQCRRILEDLNMGDSISVNGVCLTAKSCTSGSFTCDVSYNTFDTTSFKYCHTGDIVNLESSMTPSDKLGGHIISGHADCTVKILNISAIGKSHLINLELPPGIHDFVVPKGSIAVDGISLTVSKVKGNSFSVVIIPYTYEHTNLPHKTSGSMVNIEVDMTYRYVVNFLQNRNTENTDPQKLKDKILKEKLEKYGFTKQEK